MGPRDSTGKEGGRSSKDRGKKKRKMRKGLTPQDVKSQGYRARTDDETQHLFTRA